MFTNYFHFLIARIIGLIRICETIVKYIYEWHHFSNTTTTVYFFHFIAINFITLSRNEILEDFDPIFILLSRAPGDPTLLNSHISLNVNYRQKIEMGTAIYLISPKWPFDVFICIILCKSELDKSLSSKVRPNSTLLISIIGIKFLISSPSASTISPLQNSEILFRLSDFLTSIWIR